MKMPVIFASLILGLSITASANTATTITDDSSVANTPTGTMLVNGSEIMFSHYADQKMSRLTRQSTWQTYMDVVTMYSQNPVSVLGLTAAQRDNFKVASSVVMKQLGKRKDSDASLWANQVENTVRVISYFWAIAPDEAQVTENEPVKNLLN